ncbi:hypothetical protein ABKN59_001813 [Abortiporus biennis]
MENRKFPYSNIEEDPNPTSIYIAFHFECSDTIWDCRDVSLLIAPHSPPDWGLEEGPFCTYVEPRSVTGPIIEQEPVWMWKRKLREFGQPTGLMYVGELHKSAQETMKRLLELKDHPTTSSVWLKGRWRVSGSHWVDNALQILIQEHFIDDIPLKIRRKCLLKGIYHVYSRWYEKRYEDPKKLSICCDVRGKSRKFNHFQ